MASEVCTSARINSVAKSIESSSFSAMKILCLFFFFPIRISISSFKSLLEKSQEILPTCTQIRHLDKQIQLPFKICLIEAISVH